MISNIYIDVFIQRQFSAIVPLVIFMGCLVFAGVTYVKGSVLRYKVAYGSLVFSPLLCGMIFFIKEVIELVDNINKWALIKNGEVIFNEIITLVPIVLYALIYTLILCFVDFVLHLKNKV